MIDLFSRFPHSCYYMSSTSNIKSQYLDCFGFIQHIRQSGIYKHIKSGLPWILDNCAFSGKFDLELWKKRMLDYSEYKGNCICIVVPDKVSDHIETLRRFEMYAPIIRGCGYPVALATQDGLTPEQTPWGEFDVLFVGGSDDHKLGREAGALIAEAQRRRKWVHIGRVNSPKRMRKFWSANSWDGTQLSFQPDNYTPAIAYAVKEIRALQQTERMF